MGVPPVVVVQRGASSLALSRMRKFKGKEQQASHAREYVGKVEGELQRIRGGILALMDENLIPSASTGESKELNHKIKCDQIIDIPVVEQRQIHMDRTAQKTSEIPKLRFVDKLGDGCAGHTVSTRAGRGGGR